MDPFLGEIRMFGGNFAPAGWATCDGQLLSIDQNAALFSLIGTIYGGNGQTTFALPDLRGRLPMHTSTTHALGEKGGEASHTLILPELPAHTHQANGTGASGTTVSPAGAQWAGTVGAHYAGSAQVAMAGAAVQPAGGGQPHENRPPFLTLSFVIALTGIYPSRS